MFHVKHLSRCLITKGYLSDDHYRVNYQDRITCDYSDQRDDLKAEFCKKPGGTLFTDVSRETIIIAVTTLYLLLSIVKQNELNIR